MVTVDYIEDFRLAGPERFLAFALTAVFCFLAIGIWVLAVQLHSYGEISKEIYGLDAIYDEGTYDNPSASPG